MPEVSRNEMLDFINEKVSDKSLTCGCRIVYQDNRSYNPKKLRTKTGRLSLWLSIWTIWPNDMFITGGGKYRKVYRHRCRISKHSVWWFYRSHERYERDPHKLWLPDYSRPVIAILWHPVMIWDVLDRCFENWIEMEWEWDDEPGIVTLWGERTELRKPIERQSIECIKYIYSLLKLECATTTKQ